MNRRPARHWATVLELVEKCQSTNQSVDYRGKTVYRCHMHSILVWSHIGSMMVAFGASPMGRLGLRHLLSEASEPQAARAIAQAFSAVFLVGGISVTVGVGVGLVLAWNAALLAQRWVVGSILLITIAGIGNVAIEDRWLKRLGRADAEAFTAVLHDKPPFVAALVSPVIWLLILWLMIEKPA